MLTWTIRLALVASAAMLALPSRADERPRVVRAAERAPGGADRAPAPRVAPAPQTAPAPRGIPAPAMPPRGGRHGPFPTAPAPFPHHPHHHGGGPVFVPYVVPFAVYPPYGYGLGFFAEPYYDPYAYEAVPQAPYDESPYAAPDEGWVPSPECDPRSPAYDPAWCDAEKEP